VQLTLSELHLSLRQTVRRLVEQEVAPQAEAIEAGGIPAELRALLGELDLWSLTLPESRGGAGLDALAFVLVVEELASASPSLAHRYGVHAGPATAVLAASDLDLSPLITGELASWTDGGLAPEAESYFVRALEKGAEIRSGARVRRVATTGLRGAALAEHEGGETLAEVPDTGQRWADLAVAAGCLGAGRAALRAALTYAQERRQFGRAIASFQAIQFKLADASALVDATELMVWRAATSEEASASAAARAFAGRMIGRVASEALQIHGGYGYTREFPIERLLRAGRQWDASPDAPRRVLASGALGFP